MENDDLLQDDLADDFDEESVDDTDEEPFDDDPDADADESEDEDEQKPAKKSADKTEKRVRDLQSRLDKALAELNQIKKKAPNKDGGTEDRARDPEVEQWLNAAKDVTRTRIFESDPRLKSLGFDTSVITGDSPEEMQASQKALLRIIQRVQTRTRNEVLREHGFSPPPREGGRERSRNYSTMSQDEFDRIVKEATG